MKKRTLITTVMFIAVFGSSMTGAKLFGLSLNKISLIPLELVLLSQFAVKTRLNSRQCQMISWYVLTVLSGIIGLFIYKPLIGFENKIILYIVQVLFIYIPKLLFINVIDEPYEKFKVAIIKTAQINAIWAMIQFFCWYGIRFDFNDFVFNFILKGILGTKWTAWNYEMGTLAIRITGLNYDSAFLAIVLIFGFCLVKKKFWKFTFFIACVLSMSRAGIVTICTIQAMMLYGKVKNKLNVQKIIMGIGTSLFIIGVFVYAYIKIPSIQYQVDYTIHRFSSIISRSDVGTSRHLSYIPLAFYVWFHDFSLIRKIFGIGPRVGGTAFALSHSISDSIHFSNYMMTNAWTVECDIAEMILGHGISALVLYAVLWKILRTCKVEYKNCIIGLTIMGIMYNVLETTIVQLFIICLLSIPVDDKKAIQSYGAQVL